MSALQMGETGLASDCQHSHLVAGFPTLSRHSPKRPEEARNCATNWWFFSLTWGQRARLSGRTRPARRSLLAVYGRTGATRKAGEWIRTIAIITVPSNELVAQIHDRMPLILPKAAYERWLGEERDPHDLLVPFPADTMAMWPVSTRVNSPENDDASLLDPAAEELSLKSVAER